MDLATKEKILEHLTSYIEPYTGAPLKHPVLTLNPDNKRVHLSVTLGFPSQRYTPVLIDALKKHLAQIGCIDPLIEIKTTIRQHVLASGLKPLPQVKNIIAVASGKGGVGKSTTAVNLALALQSQGASIGILDADIYGPNQPLLLGTEEKPPVKTEQGLTPVMRHGLQSMSIGYLVDARAPMVWRGPMVSGALQQLLTETLWSALDYLIIDLPPGTGDVQLTLAQKIPVSGVLIVTTPQEIALLDVHKAIQMFKKVNLPLLGIIENMSLHLCPACGHAERIFGEGGGEHLAQTYGVPLLGSLPLDGRIREHADAGRPTVIAEPESALTELYQMIATAAVAQLSQQQVLTVSKFPTIIVSD